MKQLFEDELFNDVDADCSHLWKLIISCERQDFVYKSSHHDQVMNEIKIELKIMTQQFMVFFQKLRLRIK